MFVYDGYNTTTQTSINNGTSSDISNGENNRISHAFISSDGTQVFLYTPTSGSHTNFTISSMVAFDSTWSGSRTLSITGSSVNDIISDRGEGGSLNKDAGSI